MCSYNVVSDLVKKNLRRALVFTLAPHPPTHPQAHTHLHQKIWRTVTFQACQCANNLFDHHLPCNLSACIKATNKVQNGSEWYLWNAGMACCHNPIFGHLTPSFFLITFSHRRTTPIITLIQNQEHRQNQEYKTFWIPTVLPATYWLCRPCATLYFLGCILPMFLCFQYTLSQIPWNLPVLASAGTWSMDWYFRQPSLSPSFQKKTTEYYWFWN